VKGSDYSPLLCIPEATFEIPASKVLCPVFVFLWKRDLYFKPVSEEARLEALRDPSHPI